MGVHRLSFGQDTGQDVGQDVCMRLLDSARQVKHLGFVVQKRVRRWMRKKKFDVATTAFRDVERLRPYVYRPERYADTFLSVSVRPRESSTFPRRAFALWTGDNPLTANRAKNLEIMEQRLGLPVELVTPGNLQNWVVPGHPLHPAYEHLSLTHRSDYLRGYLMNHHGGAYVDIKEPLESWSIPFEGMKADPDAWVTSYSTTQANWIGKLPGVMGRDILVRHRLMFGKGGFMMRSQTPITAEWVAEMDQRLDRVSDLLAKYPGGTFGEDPDYPLSWTDLLGRVLDPLTLKYLPHVRYDDRMLLRFEGYR